MNWINLSFFSSLDLKIGKILAVFNSSGNIPCLIELFTRQDNDTIYSFVQNQLGPRYEGQRILIAEIGKCQSN